MLPVLTTARLLLRQRHDDDVPAILRMDADPEVMRFIDGPRTDMAAHEKEVRARIRQDFGPRLGYWSVFPRDRPGEFIGYVSLHRMPSYEDDIELGYRFCRSAWGHAFATEAAAALLDHAFVRLALPEVVAVVHPDNRRSLRVIDKLTFATGGHRHAYGKELRLFRLDRARYLSGAPAHSPQ